MVSLMLLPQADQRLSAGHLSSLARLVTASAVDVPINSKRVRDIRNGFWARHSRACRASKAWPSTGRRAAAAPSLAAYVARHITDQLDPVLLKSARGPASW